MRSPTFFSVRIAPWLLSGFALIAVGCGTTQVHRIAGGDSSTDAYDVLFLGAGFETDDQLEAYRSAAGSLADSLMTKSEPYLRHAENLRFWRIDVRSGAIDTSRCPVSAVLTAAPCGHETIAGPPPSAPAPPLETLSPDGAATVEKDLEVSLCWTDTAGTGSCRLLWASPDGQRRAAELAALAPDIDAVVILANTRQWAGAGLQDGLSASLSLIVAGVPLDGEGHAEGVNLLAHELAHALGLADEYSDASGTSVVPASGFGNVWQPPDPCYAPDTVDPFKATGDALGIPWVNTLDCKSALDPKLECDYTGADNACPRVWYPYHSTATCSDLRSNIDPQCLAYAGLIEGAYYTKEGIYRPMWSCRMNETSSEFCAVCATWIEQFFICNYVSPGSC